MKAAKKEGLIVEKKPADGADFLIPQTPFGMTDIEVSAHCKNGAVLFYVFFLERVERFFGGRVFWRVAGFFPFL